MFQLFTEFLPDSYVLDSADWHSPDFNVSTGCPESFIYASDGKQGQSTVYCVHYGVICTEKQEHDSRLCADFAAEMYPSSVSPDNKKQVIFLIGASAIAVILILLLIGLLGRKLKGKFTPKKPGDGEEQNTEAFLPSLPSMTVYGVSATASSLRPCFTQPESAGVGLILHDFYPERNHEMRLRDANLQQVTSQ